MKLVKEINDQDVKKAVEARRGGKSWEEIQEELKIQGSISSFVMKIRPLVRQVDSSLLGGGGGKSNGEPRAKKSRIVKEERRPTEPKRKLKDVPKRATIWAKAKSIGKLKHAVLDQARRVYKFENPVVVRVHEGLMRRNPEMMAFVIGESNEDSKKMRKPKGRRRRRAKA